MGGARRLALSGPCCGDGVHGGSGLRGSESGGGLLRGGVCEAVTEGFPNVHTLLDARAEGCAATSPMRRCGIANFRLPSPFGRVPGRSSHIPASETGATGESTAPWAEGRGRSRAFSGSSRSTSRLGVPLPQWRWWSWATERPMIRPSWARPRADVPQWPKERGACMHDGSQYRAMEASSVGARGPTQRQVLWVVRQPGAGRMEAAGPPYGRCPVCDGNSIPSC